MQKQNIFHDNDYCRLISMCVSYRCPYGVSTLANDIYMAENIMNLADANSSMFVKEDDMSDIMRGDDDD